MLLLEPAMTNVFKIASPEPVNIRKSDFYKL